MQYGYIIDTDEYAGNFEREMCAWITGTTGDCGVGHRLADEYDRRIETVQIADEYDCERPVRVHPTPGYYNNGLGFAYKDGEEDLALQEHKKSAVETYTGYIRNNIISYEHFMKEKREGWTYEGIVRSIGDHVGKITRSLGETVPAKFPSYQSVLIFLAEKPNARTIGLIERRAHEYVSYRNYKKDHLDPITIEGFRVFESEGE